MTAEEHDAEGAEEAIEDLEAPAAMQGDVAGGACIPPTCAGPTKVVVYCHEPTCVDTETACEGDTHAIVLHQA